AKKIPGLFQAAASDRGRFLLPQPHSPPWLMKTGMILAKPIFGREKPADIAIFREIAVKRFR
ncbi:hypothetical protein, partial [Mesorhizobium sp. M7A.T.Ca.US.000.02.2.1]|uniref:hypothetical protein n=1 Tax=Mesorhizobium sp. M7A.T.Ca.US.000.02.2.1 TaxID=2496793 RepID=UPI001AEC94F3